MDVPAVVPRNLRRAAAALLLAALAESALAYRPFDSTDADVAGPGEFELELGPLGWLREGSRRLRAFPAYRVR